MGCQQRATARRGPRDGDGTYSSGLGALLLGGGIGVEGEGRYARILGLLHHVLLGILRGGSIVGSRLLLELLLLLLLGLDGVLLLAGHGASVAHAPRVVV